LYSANQLNAENKHGMCENNKICDFIVWRKSKHSWTCCCKTNQSTRGRRLSTVGSTRQQLGKQLLLLKQYKYICRRVTPYRHRISNCNSVER